MSAITVEPWELRSELVFVSPEVFSRAIELMPERDPYAFLEPAAHVLDIQPEAGAHALATAAAAHVVRRTIEVVRHGATLGAALALLAALTELVR